MSRPPILLGEHRLLSERITQAADDSQADCALQKYATQLKKAGEKDAANLVGNFGAACEFHEALCNISERLDKALRSLSGNRIGVCIDFDYFDPGVFNLELVFNTAKLTTRDGIIYRDDTNLSEAQVNLVNNCFRPLTETAGKLMKEAGHPLQYRPDAESYSFSFSAWQVPVVTDYLETLASGYE